MHLEASLIDPWVNHRLRNWLLLKSRDFTPISLHAAKQIKHLAVVVKDSSYNENNYQELNKKLSLVYPSLKEYSVSFYGIKPPGLDCMIVDKNTGVHRPFDEGIRQSLVAHPCVCTGLLWTAI